MINSMKKLTIIVSALMAVTATTKAQNFNDPDITQVPAIYSPNRYIPPNLFFLLDDSSSMDAEMNYDPNNNYAIPPNPDSYNASTGTFQSFPPPTVSTGNGFAANGFSGADDAVFPPSDCAPAATDSINCYIWSSFYSSRSLSMKSALANALVGETRALNVDLNYLNANTNATNNLNLVALDRNHASYPANLASVLRVLYGEPIAGSTPTRERVLDIYAALQSLATIEDETNVFLPLHRKDDPDYSYNKDDLLYCKRNYNVVLSDGDYNCDQDNMISLTTDTDAQNATFIWRRKSGENVTIDFRGDGSVPEQRLFAGGAPSLDQRTGWWCGTSGASLLTDIVFDNWLRDLNTDLVDEISPSIRVEGTTTITSSTGTSFQVGEVWNRNNNPSYWQNLVTSTIGLGIGNPLTDPNIADQMASTATPFSWPAVTNSANTVADFVRAGYLGRGGFYRADTSRGLQNAFEQIIENAADDSESLTASAATVTSGQITSSSNNLMFSTTFDPSNWTGDLKATWLYSGVESSPASLPSDQDNCFDTLPPTVFVGQLCTASGAKWSAQDKMITWSNRKIFSMKRESGVSEGIDFKANQMSAEQLAYFDGMHDDSPGDLDSTVSNQDIVDYLSGDQTLISTQSNIESDRPDNRLLGDFGRGSPVYLGNPDTHIWGADETDWPSGVTMGSRHIVFAGNNDGMLHAFDAISGKEEFAYVPNSIYAKLRNRVLESLPHVAMVDGQVAVQDIVDIHDSDAKKTVLVSGLGAGARGLFALDVTNPYPFKKEHVLWELDENDDSRLGHIFAKPSIIRVEGDYKGSLGTGSAEANRWVVVVGTGYGNVGVDSGIMVIDAVSGEILDFLKLPGAQGLGEIVWVDHQKMISSDASLGGYLGVNSFWGELDRGYVADLRGNVWVLDFAYDSDNPSETQLRSAVTVGSINDAGTTNNRAHLESLLVTPADTSDDVPAPLFIATDQAATRQPITARITVNRHPSGRGYMLYVGTGDILSGAPLVDGGDCANIDCIGTGKVSANSIYGIWDDIGDNVATIATKDVEQYNVTRDRRFLTFYPWRQAETTFANGDQAYVRVNDTSGAKAIIKSPIKWANLTGFGDSKPVALTDYATDPVLSSGWLTDTGFNVSLKQSERVFQPAALIINQNGEEGVTFYMHTLDTAPDESDPCAPKSNIKTWQLSYRTDIIDGPLAAFSASMLDINDDGNIDADDKTSDPSSLQIVPLGGIPLAATGTTIDGKDGLLTGYTITEGSIIVPGPSSTPTPTPGPSAAKKFCPNGITRGYTTMLADGTQKQIKTCKPFALSSWTEFE